VTTGIFPVKPPRQPSPEREPQFQPMRPPMPGRV